MFLGVLCAASPDASAQQAVGGVYIDAAGMLHQTSSLSQEERLRIVRDAAAVEAASPDVAAPSPLRKISLRRLEQQVAELHAAGKPLPADVRFLAGLHAIHYVLFYPDHKDAKGGDAGDTVIAGPAEGWKQLPNGDVVGSRSNQPVLHLDDLLVTLRFAFGNRPDGFLGCSIEPTDDGMRTYGQYMGQIGANFDRSQIDDVIRGMERAMGPQSIRVFGSPPTSRFALKMVAADYRLKRIALAHDPSPVKKVASYLDMAAKGLTRTSGPQPQHRWWFVGHFDAIRHTPDRNAFEFEGQGVTVQTAPTSLGTNSNPAEPKPSRSATLFAEAFTRNFSAMADQVPVFNELKNLVGLALAAELIRDHADRAPPREAGTRAEAAVLQSTPWKPNHFLDEQECPITVHEAPRQTPSLANVRLVRDRHWMFSVSGGVEIAPSLLASPENFKPAAGEKLPALLSGNAPPTKSSQFWWD